MEVGQFVKGFIYGLISCFVLISIHADWMGRDKYTEWVYKEWVNTKVWYWVVFWIIFSIIMYRSKFNIRIKGL